LNVDKKVFFRLIYTLTLKKMVKLHDCTQIQTNF